MERSGKIRPPPVSISLCLSGGGLRATFFHLGVIRALRRLHLLHKVTDIISVSGGSIIAAHLVRHWKQYIGTPEEFDLAQSDLLSLRDWDLRGNVVRRSVLWWPLYFLSLRFPRFLSRLRMGRTELLRREYDKYFSGLTLDDLRQSSEGSPQFHLVSTNLVTGSLCSFTKQHYVVVENNQLTPYAAELTKVSMAVTASSAFPPVFPPILFDERMTGGKSGAFHGSSHVLTDGGVYDNTGYESAALFEADQKSKGGKLSDLIVVSDAGSPFQWRHDSEFRNPVSLAVRASEVAMNRVAEETLKRIVSEERIALLSIDRIEEGESLPPMIQRAISRIRTDLDRFSDVEAAALVTHGENKANRQLMHQFQSDADATASSMETNKFPIDLPPSAELASAINKSWQVKWWNSLLNFYDWRTYVIYVLSFLILSAPVVGSSYWFKRLERNSAQQAADNQARDFETTMSALKLQNDALIARSNAKISELQKQLSTLQPQRQACRHPSHGPPERFLIDQTITRESEWRPGGYNQGAWCGDVETQLRAQFIDPILKRVASNEYTRDTCTPFRCIQYKYSCTIQVLANPVYPMKVSPACPVAEQ